MKKTILLLQFILLIALLACHREEVLQQSEATQQFLRGESSAPPTRIYYLKNMVGVAHRPTLNSDFRPIFRKYPLAEQWPAAQAEFAATYDSIWTDPGRNTDIDVLIDLEIFTYNFLNDYIFKVTPDEVVRKAAAYHVQHLFELKQPAQWDVLARAMLLSREQLPRAQWETYRQYIVRNARQTLDDERATAHLQPEARTVQLQAARFALEELAKVD